VNDGRRALWNGPARSGGIRVPQRRAAPAFLVVEAIVQPSTPTMPASAPAPPDLLPREDWPGARSSVRATLTSPLEG
jgi:hypothetical protein